jgi:hypothetical protein
VSPEVAENMSSPQIGVVESLTAVENVEEAYVDMLTAVRGAQRHDESPVSVVLEDFMVCEFGGQFGVQGHAG